MFFSQSWMKHIYRHFCCAVSVQCIIKSIKDVYVRHCKLFSMNILCSEKIFIVSKPERKSAPSGGNEDPGAGRPFNRLPVFAAFVYPIASL